MPRKHIVARTRPRYHWPQHESQRGTDLLFILVCDTSLTGLLKLANSLADYAGRRQLIQAGVAEAIAAGNARTLVDIKCARSATNAIKHPRSACD